MSETKHSAEPWRWEPEAGGTVFTDANGVWVSPCLENWSRIVSCVNACSGFPTDAIEAGAIKKALEAGRVLLSVEPAVTSAGIDAEEDLLSALRSLGRLP